MSARRTTAPTGDLAPFGLRMPLELRAQIEEAARNSGRSMNAELVSCLTQSLTTLRDEFAGRAMQAVMGWDNGLALDSDDIAIVAYEQADAMLRARSQ